MTFSLGKMFWWALPSFWSLMIKSVSHQTLSIARQVQDAYEEVEEQRAVAAQWKRKLQKLTNDMADLRSLLDEQTCRNNLLEKRQRKFDAELHAAQEELKRERAAKERLSRERDQAHAEKYAVEQSLTVSDVDVEVDCDWSV